MTRRPIYSTLLLAVLIGTITDKTTSQPLAGVTVSATDGSHTLRARTDSAGSFTFRSISEGTYTLHFSSRDVPAQTTKIRVQGSSTRISLKACSVTLDYSCGGDSSGGG